MVVMSVDRVLGRHVQKKIWIYESLVQDSMTWYAVLGVPEATLSLSDSLEGLTELNKAVILTITVYYGKRIQTKFSKGKGHVRQHSRHQRWASSCLPLWELCRQGSPVPTMTCVNMHGYC